MERREFEDSGDGRHRRRTVTDLLNAYGRWRKKRIREIVDAPLRSLALKSLFFVVCIVVDGVMVPSVILIFGRSFFAYLLFGALFILAVAAEAYLYGRFLKK